MAISAGGTRRATLAVAIVGILLIVAAVASGHARGWAVAFASRRLGRPVHVQGALSIRAGLAGPTISFTDLSIDEPAWAGPGRMASVARGRIDLPWSVLVGDSRVRAVALDGVRLALRRDAQGRTNWLSAGTQAPPRSPQVDSFVLKDGVVDILDAQRSVSFHGVVGADASPEGSTLKLAGGGITEGQAWSADVAVARNRRGPPAYDLDAQIGLQSPAAPSRLHFKGRLTLSGKRRLDGALAIAGPDLHAFAHLGDLPLPRTPPYQLTLRIAVADGKVRLSDASGRVGASDLEGAMTIAPQQGLRRIEASLHSRSLRVSDLLAVASGGELTGPRKPGRLLPDGAINATPLRKLLGTVSFAASSVQAPAAPTIRDLRLGVSFDRGLISADPIALDLARGRAVLRVRLDVRGVTPRIGFDADVHGADTGDVFKGGARAPLQADFDASAHLQGSGASLAAAAAAASGDAQFHAFDGRLQQVQAEVLSANLARGLISLMTKTRGDVGLRCAVGRFRVLNGQARATELRLSTDVGGAVGYGGLDLKAQTLDITLRPDGAASGPTSVRIDGPIAHPKATLALDDPRTVLRKALGGLVHAAAPSVAPGSGCG